MTWQKSYHGWLIEIIPKSTGYLFQCWIPKENVGISNHKIYPTYLQAFTAAKKRADVETAVLALLHFLNQSYKTCNLSPDEHVALAQSITDVVKNSQ
jgi:hypothetical protein